MITDRSILDHIAREPLRAPRTLEDQLALHAELARALESGIGRALVAGHSADRLGHAFASGYVEALVSLDPRGKRAVTAFAVTEKGGGHPRAVETLAEPAEAGVALRGKKAFVTLASHAERAFVVAKEGAREDGTPRLGVYEVSLPHPKARLAALPATPFAPELTHASLELEGVVVPAEARLPGDGYLSYVRPFRTIEDLHVLAAFTGYRLALSRRMGLGPDDLSRGLALAAALLGLGALDPKSQALHLALDHVFEEAAGYASPGESALAGLGPEERERFVRDLPLLKVAGSARRARAEKARAALMVR